MRAKSEEVHGIAACVAVGRWPRRSTKLSRLGSLRDSCEWQRLFIQELVELSDGIEKENSCSELDSRCWSVCSNGKSTQGSPAITGTRFGGSVLHLFISVTEGHNLRQECQPCKDQH
jgi:hypothetical protein